jgi:hypothetical protein
MRSGAETGSVAANGGRSTLGGARAGGYQFGYRRRSLRQADLAGARTVDVSRPDHPETPLDPSWLLLRDRGLCHSHLRRIDNVEAEIRVRRDQLANRIQSSAARANDVDLNITVYSQPLPEATPGISDSVQAPERSVAAGGHPSSILVTVVGSPAPL